MNQAGINKELSERAARHGYGVEWHGDEYRLIHTTHTKGCDVCGDLAGVNNFLDQQDQWKKRVGNSFIIEIVGGPRGMNFSADAAIQFMQIANASECGIEREIKFTVWRDRIDAVLRPMVRHDLAVPPACRVELS
jgi:hypothetical protein